MTTSSATGLSIARMLAVATLLLTAAASRATIIDSADLLTVSNTNVLRSYTFGGILVDTLQITGLPAPLMPTGVAQGVSVIDDRMFIGLVSTVGAFTPKIVEIDPATGVVIVTHDTATPYITGLGDNGTQLLLLHSVNEFRVDTYDTDGSFVSQVAMERPFAGIYQGEGIDGDGQSIFISYLSGSQPIVTNTVAGDHVSYFDTNLNQLFNFIGAIAYDPSDQSLWIAGTNEFRNYSQAGTLLSVAPTGAFGTTPVGLEVISGRRAIPEPSTWALTTCLMLTAGVLFARCKRVAARQSE